jgi:hypothetical protein
MTENFAASAILYETPFMVRLGSPRTEDKSLNFVPYPFALSFVEGLLKVFTQSGVQGSANGGPFALKPDI